MRGLIVSAGDAPPVAAALRQTTAASLLQQAAAYRARHGTTPADSIAAVLRSRIELAARRPAPISTIAPPTRERLMAGR